MNNQIVTVNLIPDLSAPAVVKVSQYDVGRPITFNILDGASAASISPSMTVTVVGTKPSGLGFSQSAVIASLSTVTINTTLAMTQECGMIPAEIRFTQSGENVGTANFILAVEPSPHPDGTTDGTQETMASLETRLQGEIDDLSDRIDDIEAGGSGLSQTEKNLILTLFSKAAYAESDADVAYEQLESLWATTDKTVTYNLSHVTSSNRATTVAQGASYTTTLTLDTDYTLETIIVKMGGVDITATAYSSGTISIPSVTGNIVITASAVLVAESITAVYTQSGDVYTTDSLDSLKPDLVVTANYSGGSSEIVTAYTLSGTLTTGPSTITVEYGGLTTTFNVTVSAQPGMDWISGQAYDLETGMVDGYYLNNGVETVSSSGYACSPYLDCSGAWILSDTAFTSYNGEYDDEKTYIRKDNIKANTYYNFDDYDAAFFRVSIQKNALISATITPYDLPQLAETTVWQSGQYYKTELPNIGSINDSGVVQPNQTSYRYSELMNCYNATTIIDSYNGITGIWRAYVFYDGNGDFISRSAIATASTTGTVTVPSGARYFRFIKVYPSIGVCFTLS